MQPSEYAVSFPMSCMSMDGSGFVMPGRSYSVCCDAISIIRPIFSCRVQSGPGCGATSTLSFVAMSHPQLSFLYTCYDKAKLERARSIMPDNVICR